MMKWFNDEIIKWWNDLMMKWFNDEIIKWLMNLVDLVLTARQGLIEFKTSNLNILV